MSDSNGTKSLLARSMKNLMAEKAFAKINITDICEGCGLNRKSFYYHFKDKYDLMNWIFYTDFIALVGTSSYEDGWGLLEAVCELFYKDSKFYRAAMKTDGQNSFKEYLLESMLPMVAFLFDDVFESEENETIGKIFCESYIMIVAKWIEDGCKTTPAVFVKTMKAFVKRIAASIPD